jgi:hypothetical protein|nr:MAG TPA: hypothetical protein [Caudoviricetes sp.]
MDITASLTFAGAAAPLIVAAVTRAGWSANAKRWAAIATAAVLSGLVWALTRYPESTAGVMGELGGVIAAMQVAYTALKPTGLLDWIEERTE